MDFSKSKIHYREALRYMPGGVSSPVRAFRAVKGTPLFIEKGKGSRIFDADGNSFIDYIMSWGALIHGHAYPPVVREIREQAVKGTSFGTPTGGETELSRKIIKAIPSIRKLRFVNSGTEAVMSAIRLTRAFTRREKILKFAGQYHGHYDPLLVNPGRGKAGPGVPGSAGISKQMAGQTLVCPYNDIQAFRRILKRHQKELACVILEPVCGNRGVMIPKEEFVKQVRELTEQYKILLIFDEVITGFRFHRGGVQTLLGIRPDLTCLGKIIGGGLPMGAYGGREDLMEMISPSGPVYQAGTLSGNPLAVRAGIKVLDELERKNFEKLDQRTAGLCNGLEEVFHRSGIQVRVNRFGSMFSLFFSNRPVSDLKSALLSDEKKYKTYFWGMLHRGIYLPPAPLEANFLSFSHQPKDLEWTLEAANQVALEMKKK